MKNKAPKRLLAALLSVAICVGTLTIPAGAADTLPSAANLKAAHDFIFDSTVSDVERMELQNAYLRGMIPEELVGDVNRDITQAEFRRLFARLMEYMNITPAQDMENWLNEGSDAVITRGMAADEFMWAYYVFMGREFEVLSMSGVPQTNIYCDGPTEILERNGEDGWLMFFTHNTDSTTGAPLMDRDLDGYLRLEDNMTVKEAVQLMYRFSNRCIPELEYVALSDIKTPIALTEEELSAAAKMPTPTYSNLPKYQGTWYLVGSYVREDTVYETDFSTLSDMGFNFFRYSFTQDVQNNLMDKNGNICLSTIEALDKAVHLAIKYGIHLRLQIWDKTMPINMKNGVMSESGEVIFTPEEYQKYITSIFAALAARYKNVPNSILSFHIFDEPLAHDEYEKNWPDQYITLQQLCDYAYLIADAVWAEDDDRLMATDGPWGGYPSIAIAEDGIKRNLTSNGKERRILQNFHCFIPDYCWTNGFYGEMPSVSNYNADFIPPSVNDKNRYVIKANSDGFSKGTEIKLRDDNGNTAYLSLVTSKDGNPVEELKGVEGTDSRFMTYTLTKDADAFTITCTNPDHSSSLKYIWITYPEKASEKIPIFGYFTEDDSRVYGAGGYEEFIKNNANGLMDIRDIAHSTVVRFTDRKTTHITIGGASQGHVGNWHDFVESEPRNDVLGLAMQVADVDIRIKDGNDNRDYSATFTNCYYTFDETVYHYTPEDIMDAYMKVWTDFQEKYGTVCMQNEMGPNNGSRKKVIYDYLDFWLRYFTEAGMPWGGICGNLGSNGCLLDDCIYQGDYVQYDFHRVEAGQLAVIQKYMTRFDIDEVGQLPYTGKAQKPVLKVRFKGKALTLGKDYEVSYHDNTEPGIATAVVTGIGDYEGIFTTQRFFISIFKEKPEPAVGKTVKVGKATYKFLSDSEVALYKVSSTSDYVTVPETVVIDGEKYKVSSISAGAFKSCKKLKTLVIENSSLSKSGVKGALTGSTVKTVKLVGSAQSKLSEYKKYFAKSNSGKTVTVKKAVGSTAAKGNLTYKITSDSEVALYKATGSSTTVTVPAEVTIDGQKYKVTAISSGAFKSCKKLSTLIIKSNTLTKAGVKNSLKSSTIKTIRLSGAAQSKLSSYMKYFAKANSGKTVTVRKS